MTPLTQRQQTLIVNNVIRACKDINALNKMGYNFLYLAQGFIANFSIYGFKHVYSKRSLKEEILRFADRNQWNNFHPGDKDYEYYMTKKNVYNRIAHALAVQ